MSIEAALISHLCSLYTDVGTRIYREFLPQEPKLPAIVVTRTGGRSITALGGVTLMTRGEFKIEVFADDAATVGAVAAQIQAGLSATRRVGTNPTIVRCTMSSQAEDSVVDGDNILRAVAQVWSVTFC